MSFQKQYSRVYDAVHNDRDFAQDVRVFIGTLPKSSVKNLNLLKILDFGCGTGNHTYELSKLSALTVGYDVSPDMISNARAKYPQQAFTSNLVEISGNFDLVFSLFDVISYQFTDLELTNYFQDISKALRVGGYAVLDGWHADGVRNSPPSYREKKFTIDNYEYSRKVTPSPSNSNGFYELKITVENSLTHEIVSSEIHKLRALSFDELNTIAVKYGLEIISFKDRLHPEKSTSTESWKFIAVLQKRESIEF
jgi:SAM-dependent methyltransferase